MYITLAFDPKLYTWEQRIWRLDAFHSQVDAPNGAQNYGHGTILQWDLCRIAEGYPEPADDLSQTDASLHLSKPHPDAVPRPVAEGQPLHGLPGGHFLRREALRIKGLRIRIKILVAVVGASGDYDLCALLNHKLFMARHHVVVEGLPFEVGHQCVEPQGF